MAQHNDTGKKGEVLAIAFIEKAGYAVIHTNWRAGRNEVDIIATKQGVLHFMEVKTKTGKSIGTPEQRVNQAKITRMKQAASDYLVLHSEAKSIQFDIISIQILSHENVEIFITEDVF
jgi:putative endonuclease